MAERGRRSRAPNKSRSGAQPAARRVFGLHAARAVIAQRPDAIRHAALLAGKLRGPLAELDEQLASLSTRVKRAPRSELDQLADSGVHQGIVLEVQPLKEFSLSEFEDLVLTRQSTLRLLVLDQVEDPRNLGACLRSAAAAAVDAVVVPKDRSAGLSPAAIKAAAGASEFVPLVRVTNLARTLRFLSEAGIRIAGAALDAPVTLYEAELAAPIALVLGSEGTGMRRLTREHCDELFSIPMPGAIESLNVAVSAGIVLFESLRRR